MTRGHTTRVIFTVKICIFERSNEKSHFSKTKIYFHKKTAPQLSGHIGLQNMKVGVKTNFELLTPSLSWIAGKILTHFGVWFFVMTFCKYILSEAMFSTQLNDAHFIVLASFVSREEMTVDKQLSEAGTSSSACGWYKARLLSKDKRNSNLFFLAVDSRHFVGAWAKSNEINQAKKQACGAVVALALS